MYIYIHIHILYVDIGTHIIHEQYIYIHTLYTYIYIWYYMIKTMYIDLMYIPNTPYKYPKSFRSTTHGLHSTGGTFRREAERQPNVQVTTSLGRSVGRWGARFAWILKKAEFYIYNKYIYTTYKYVYIYILIYLYIMYYIVLICI